jgi:drug/metabolite transporter (DMT)-like permease
VEHVVIAVVLAVAAAVGWGAADYFGGDASRGDTPVFVVVALGELLGVVLMLPVLIARGAPPADPGLLLAAVAGVAVTVELSLIYRALARGEAFITAPVGALGAAGAVTIGLIGGDPFDATIALGLLCALAGGAVSAWTSRGGTGRKRSAGQTAAICVGAAAAIVTMLTCLHAASRLDPYWATATEHLSTALSAGLAALAGRRRPLRDSLPRRRGVPALALMATGGVGGDLAYAVASHHGALSVISAISSLYPVATIILAAGLRHRRATPVQVTGIILALAGAVVLGAAAH